MNYYSMNAYGTGDVIAPPPAGRLAVRTPLLQARQRLVPVTTLPETETGRRIPSPTLPELPPADDVQLPDFAPDYAPVEYYEEPMYPMDESLPNGTAPPKDNTALYVGLGLLAAAALGAGWFFFARKKKE